MKRTLLFIAFVLTSLTMSAQDGLTVGDIQNSGCLNKTQEKKIPTIVLTKEGSVLSVQLLNYESYTATTDFNVTSSISNDDPCTVTINVTPIIPEGAQVEWEWVCLFNVSFTIRDFEPNRFYLDCWWCKGLIELKDGEPMILEKKVENVTIDGISFSLLKASHKAMLVDWTTTEEDLHIPSKVTYENEDYTVTCISKDAFWNANQATKITVPKTVRSMNLFSDNALYANPFRECMSLKWIVVEDGCPLFSSMDEVLFAENKTMLLGYPIASPRTTYTVPKGVTKIRSGAFHHNKYLRKLMIREEVTDLGWHLFSDTQSLEELYIRGIIDPACMSDLFGGMDTKVAVYVQQSEVEKYKAVYKGPVSPLPWAQEDSDYLPFVEMEKEWHMVVSRLGEYKMMEYTLSNETVTEDATGKTYFRLYSSEGEVVHDLGLLREEDRKVYYIEPSMSKENLLFDYSLKAGDTYETYSYDEEKMVTYKVLSVDDYTEGPQVRREKYDEESGNMITHSRYLRKWTVCRTDDNSIQKTWIEGVGSFEGPLANLYEEKPISTLTYLAYVDVEFEGSMEQYLPFSFYDMYHQVHGCNFSAVADHSSSDWNKKYTYELEGDRLHVYGNTYLNCGCAHYAYFFEEPTEDPLVRKLHFQIQKEGIEATCSSFVAFNFYVPGFFPDINYIVVDESGVEHPVINKTQQMAYRPMIEDGKVWKVGSKKIKDNLVKLVGYYYFDGDTIIGGKTCKKMMFQQYVTPDYPEYDAVIRFPLLQYVGAWYEEDKKVYEYNTIDKQFKLMYDFSVDADVPLQIDGQSYVIGPKQSGGMKGFKGVYRDVMMLWDKEQNTYNTSWLEGVGGIDGPVVSVYLGEENHVAFLMSCTVGDEVIYLNDEYEDGATPMDAEAKKHRFDFTHTIKTKPKTRSEAEEQSLYGEYNNQLLDIRLNPLDDTYLVRITNESDQVVYEKTVNAGNIVALNIDISAYPEGRYTVTIENNGESFTGEFVTQTTGIEENVKTEIIKNTSIYNLQGQRLNTLQRGLNIVNGRKVYVK